MTATPLRVGLIVDTPRVPEPASEWRKLFEDGGDVEVVALIVQGLDRRPRGFLTSFRILVFHAICAVESFLLRDSARRRAARVHSESGFQTVLRVSQVGSSRQHGFEYSEEALDAIRRLKLDVLVHMGSGMLRGDVLTICPFGVLSVRHGANASVGASPEGFWQTFEGEPTTEFVIEQLAADGSEGIAVLSGDLVTRRYCTRNREQAVTRSSLYMAEVVRHIASSRRLPERQPLTLRVETRPMPGLWVQFRYALRTVARLALAAFRYAILGSRGEWSVGVARGQWDSIDRSTATTITNPKGHFLADPFVVERDGQVVCFVEDFDYRAERGAIAAYDVSGEVPVRLGNALVEPFHLSFPFVFEYDGTLYMCPETHAMREIRLYECVTFPLEWELSSVLMKDVSAVDTIVFPSGGEWWLMSTIDPAGNAANDSLQAFHAPSPLGYEWTPHTENPVRLEASLVRSGGLIRDGKRILRIGQNPGYAEYGSSVTVREIHELTADVFSEVEVARIEADFRPGIDGTHHLHSDGEWTVFDYRRTRHVWFPNLRN